MEKVARAVLDEQIEEEDQVLQVDQDEEDSGEDGEGGDEEKGDGEDGVADVDDEEGEVDEGEEGVMDSGANNEAKKSDEWVEDPDSDIMDAKVLKKGNKRLVIVDMPNPKARWRKPVS